MSDQSTKPKAYSYLRFSTADQAKGDSYRRQMALAEDYARAKGLTLDRSLTFEDLGVSAFSGKNRKRGGALRAFLDAVEDGIIAEGSFLLVESLDRISREAILDAQATFLMIVNAGVTLVTLKGTPREYSRETVTANPTDLLISLIELIRAREESETKSQRIKADWLRKRERAAAGEAITSQIPAWLRRDGKALEPIPERAEVVRRIFALTLVGQGQHAITSSLNKEGVEPFGGGRWWHRSYVTKLLKNPAVVGTFTPHRMVQGRRVPMEPLDGYFPVVVDPGVWEAVRALDRPSGKAPPNATRSMLSGLVRCEECAGPMVRSRKGAVGTEHYHVFVCQNAKLGQSCESRSVRQEVLEAALVEHVRQFAHDAPSHDDTLADEAAQLEAAMDATRDQIEGLVEAIAQKPLAALIGRLGELEASVVEMTARHQQVTDALRDTAKPVMAKRLADLETAVVGGGAIEVGRINVLLRQLVDHVVIQFDREASRRRPRGQLEFHWKGGGQSWLHWGPLF